MKQQVLLSAFSLTNASCRLPALAAEKIHTPFGRPRMLQPNQSYCILHHEGFVSAFSRSRLMPLWSSFTIQKPVRLQLRPLRSSRLSVQLGAALMLLLVPAGTAGPAASGGARLSEA